MFKFIVIVAQTIYSKKEIIVKLVRTVKEVAKTVSEKAAPVVDAGADKVKSVVELLNNWMVKVADLISVSGNRKVKEVTEKAKEVVSTVKDKVIQGIDFVAEAIKKGAGLLGRFASWMETKFAI